MFKDLEASDKTDKFSKVDEMFWPPNWINDKTDCNSVEGSRASAFDKTTKSPKVAETLFELAINFITGSTACKVDEFPDEDNSDKVEKIIELLLELLIRATTSVNESELELETTRGAKVVRASIVVSALLD